MKLFLCSNTIHPEIQNDFEDFVNSSMNELTIAFVTTAANQSKDRSWEVDDIELAKSVFKKVDLFDVEKMSRDKMRRTFSKYNILWINGGRTSYLMNQFRKTGLEEILPEILDKGVVYVGSSAGSMIWSESLEIAEWYLGEPEKGASKIPGMGLFDFQIYPHYEDPMLEDIKENKQDGEEYWLLKNGQAVSYDDGVIKIHGGEVKILFRQ